MLRITAIIRNMILEVKTPIPWHGSGSRALWLGDGGGWGRSPGNASERPLTRSRAPARSAGACVSSARSQEASCQLLDAAPTILAHCRGVAARYSVCCVAMARARWFWRSRNFHGWRDSAVQRTPKFRERSVKASAGLLTGACSRCGHASLGRWTPCARRRAQGRSWG